MAEETSDAMNLDLNLGPSPETGSGSIPSEAINLGECVDDPLRRIREAVRITSRSRQRWRWRQVQVPPETHALSVELNQLIGNSDNVGTLQAGEGSVVAEARVNEVPKICENNTGFLENEVSEKTSGVEKESGSDGSFFDCNVCLDLATDPVVTCCGHLFCWSCLYRWLHVHSDAHECPVCKGEVTTKNVTPIYGRGSNIREPEEDSEIPCRPHAKHVASWRQTSQRNSSFSFPREEMISSLGSGFDLTRDLDPQQDSDGAREMAERTNVFLSRIMTLRGQQAEQTSLAPPDDIVDLAQGGTSNPEARQARRVQPLLLRRSQSNSQRSSTETFLSSYRIHAERIIEAYLRTNPIGRNRVPHHDDRYSLSSIASGLNSETQVDNAVEINSMGALSTSSSRRRTETSRASDTDAVDSRAPRRRRFN